MLTSRLVNDYFIISEILIKDVGTYCTFNDIDNLSNNLRCGYA